MIVLSLFDGCSCARIALERAGIEIKKYYASEIDKFSIQVAQKNYPDTIQLGDIIKWQEWDIEKPDLIIGGSPCQGFSFAGKQLNFDDPRSKLFFEFVNILKHYDSKYFLLENVMMKDEHNAVITEAVGIEPIMINSALLSAQNRKRLYWTNINSKKSLFDECPIAGIEQPEDKKIVLKDIIGNGKVDCHKSYCIDANYFKGGNLNEYFNNSRRQLVFIENETILHNIYGGFKEKKPRIFNRKSPTIRTPAGGGHLPFVYTGNTGNKINFRKLTPIECERLQTLPDNYTQGVSDTQRYKMLGNGFTVDVIAYILGHIKNG